MALTLGQLASSLDLPVLAGREELGRAIGWVHPTELADPTAFLDGGELLLTTGLSLGDDVPGYVARLADAGVAGIGFGSGLSFASVPRALVTAAESAGLPLLEVPRATPFIAITKAVSAAVAADEYAAVVRTGRGQQELTRAALGRGGAGAVVRRLARLVDGWVLLLDSAGLPVEAAPASARQYAAALPAAPVKGTRGARVGEQDVVLHSLGTRTLAVGGTLDAADHYLVNTAASLLTLALDRDRTQGGPLRSGLLDLLLAGHQDLALATIHTLGHALPAPPWPVAVVLGPPTPRHTLLDRYEGSFAAVRGSAVVILAPDLRILEPLVAGLGGLHCGISDAVPIDGTERAVQQATDAATAARAASRPWLTYAEHSGSGLLAFLPSAASTYFDSLLAPLRAHPELLLSLRGWLTEHGHNDAAATRLGIHRHTLRNHLRRVETLTGRSLASPGYRAELWFALTAPTSDPA